MHPAIHRTRQSSSPFGSSNSSDQSSSTAWASTGTETTPYVSYGSQKGVIQKQTVHVFAENNLPFALTQNLRKDEADMHAIEKYLRSSHDGGFNKTLQQRLQVAKNKLKADDIFVERIQEIILKAIVDSVKNHTKLGEGSFGQVIKAKLPKLDHPEGPYIDVAIKLLRLSAQNNGAALREINNISKEIMTQAALSDHDAPHPNITQLLFEHRFQFGKDLTSTMFVLVMPCADEPLDHNIKSLKTLSPHRRELRTLQYASDMAEGIDYMHSKGFIHVDVKPKNALVFNEHDRLTVKWTDFGLTCPRGEPLCLAGSPNYLPPEILNPKCNWHLWEDRSKQDPQGLTIYRWSSKQDWFSIGVSLCEVLGLNLPDYSLPVKLDHRLTLEDYTKCWHAYETWYTKLMNVVLTLRPAVRQAILFLLKPDPKERDATWLKTCIKYRTFDIRADQVPSASYLRSGPSIEPSKLSYHHHH